jgi:hypothetical protein
MRQQSLRRIELRPCFLGQSTKGCAKRWCIATRKQLFQTNVVLL